jgi:hypothetical protein
MQLFRTNVLIYDTPKRAGCQEGNFRCAPAFDKPPFLDYTRDRHLPLVSSVHAKEATAMNPPDGPLAPLPGAQALCRQSQFRRSDVGIYSADFVDGRTLATLRSVRPVRPQSTSDKSG